jgi:pyocin large subunit-like protein
MALFCAAAASALLLSACDNGPSAVSQQQAAGTQMAVPQETARDETPARERSGVDHRDDPVQLVDGKPMWSASRRYSAEANAQRAFERNGEAFGADSRDEFVRKAHAFVGKPPRGTLTLDRTNGDTLFYDPKGNVFAIATKDGAPRTMFKPDEGMAYWDEVKAREARRSQTRQARRDTDDDA